MKPIEFDEQTDIIAKNQPQYLPFPVHAIDDPQRTIIACWSLSDSEIEEIIKTKKIWHSIWLCGKNLQPQLLSVEKPDMQSQKSNLIYG